MQVCAPMGLDRMQSAYRHAIEEGYRCHGYRDASLLPPTP
jgi:S-adenosylmethionine:tRNA ribosyltransferase-isomerase